MPRYLKRIPALNFIFIAYPFSQTIIFWFVMVKHKKSKWQFRRSIFCVFSLLLPAFATIYYKTLFQYLNFWAFSTFRSKSAWNGHETSIKLKSLRIGCLHISTERMKQTSEKWNWWPKTMQTLDRGMPLPFCQWWVKGKSPPSMWSIELRHNFCSSGENTRERTLTYWNIPFNRIYRIFLWRNGGLIYKRESCHRIALWQSANQPAVTPLLRFWLTGVFEIIVEITALCII